MGQELDLELDDPIAKPHIVEQRTPVLRLPPGIIFEACKQPLAHADAGDVGALVAEQKFSDAPTSILVAHQIAGRDPHLVEKHLVHIGAEIQRADRPHAHAGGLHVDEHEGDAFLRFAVAARAYETKHPIRELRERRPGLLPGDDVALALAARAGLERCEIGARTGFGITLTPPVLHGDDARQKMRPLRRRTEFHQHRADHRQAEGDLPGSAGLVALVIEDRSLHRGPAGAAIFLGPAGCAPALRGQYSLPPHVVFAARMLEGQHRVADVGRQARDEEFSYGVAKCLIVGGFD